VQSLKATFSDDRHRNGATFLFHSARNSGERFMGLKSINVGAREALEFTCDRAAHRGEPAIAWFDCGSDLGNVELALAAGWRERRVKRTWLCPQCAHKAAVKRMATVDKNAA
jgi:hypothetical protein